MESILSPPIAVICHSNISGQVPKYLVCHIFELKEVDFEAMSLPPIAVVIVTLLKPGNAPKCAILCQLKGIDFDAMPLPPIAVVIATYLVRYRNVSYFAGPKK